MLASRSALLKQLLRAGACEGQLAWGQLLQAVPSAPSAVQFSSTSGQKESDTTDFGFQEVPRQQKASLVAQVFSSVASSYDVMNDFMSGGLHRCWKDQLVETLRPFPGMKHLDVAGGTGDVAFRVLRAIRAAESQAALSSRATGQPGRPAAAGVGPASASAAASPSVEPGSVIVCDINPDMLAEGKRKAAAAPDLAGDQGLAFEEGNAEVLSQFADNTFDAYTIAFGIRNVTDRPAALREAYRVLKPGGRLLCLEFSQVSQPLLRQAYDAYSFAVIPRLGGLIAGDQQSYQYLVESIRQFPDQDTWCDMIEAAGFKSVGYENILGGIVAMHSGYKLP